MKYFLLVLIAPFLFIGCKEPKCAISCKGHECACSHKAEKNDKDTKVKLPWDVTPCEN